MVHFLVCDYCSKYFYNSKFSIRNHVCKCHPEKYEEWKSNHPDLAKTGKGGGGEVK